MTAYNFLPSDDPWSSHFIWRDDNPRPKRAQVSDRVSVNGWARQEIFWLKLMIKSWKINITFHASREAEFKELINGVYSAIKIPYRFTGFWTKTRS